MKELEYICHACYRYTVVIPDERLLTDEMRRRIPTDCPNCGIKLEESDFYKAAF